MTPSDKSCSGNTAYLRKFVADCRDPETGMTATFTLYTDIYTDPKKFIDSEVRDRFYGADADPKVWNALEVKIRDLGIPKLIRKDWIILRRPERCR